MTKHKNVALDELRILAALMVLPFGARELVHTDFAAMDTDILLATLFMLIEVIVDVLRSAIDMAKIGWVIYKQITQKNLTNMQLML